MEGGGELRENVRMCKALSCGIRKAPEMGVVAAAVNG
jgi:hypothetical protein